VNTGVNNDDLSRITSGLEEGDTIAISDSEYRYRRVDGHHGPDGTAALAAATAAGGDFCGDRPPRRRPLGG
jgi:hypothetical protein